MCLDLILSRPTNAEIIVGNGYKVFNTPDNGGYEFEFAHLGGSAEVPTGKWIKAESCLIGGPGNEYISGFHIFEKETDAIRWAQVFRKKSQKAVNIEYRGPTAVGKQGTRTVIVAREIFVPPPPGPEVKPTMRTETKRDL